MRASWFLILLVLAASAPAVAVGCVPSCEISATLAGFVSPVNTVPSTGGVTWTSLDVFHTATEDVPFSAGPCFNVNVPGGASGSAAFRIDGGVLKARVGDVERACGSAATPLADGSFLLRYKCNVHRSMVAELVVQPGA